MKDKKWMRGLGWKLIDSVLELDPESVEFEEVYPTHVKCTIVIKNEAGEGLAICSSLDTFNVKVGRNKSAGLAVKALVNKESSERSRFNLNEFPNTWTKRQILRIRAFNSQYRSVYIKGWPQWV